MDLYSIIDHLFIGSYAHRLEIPIFGHIKISGFVVLCAERMVITQRCADARILHLHPCLPICICNHVRIHTF